MPEITYKSFVLTSATLFSFPLMGSADTLITEIMYDLPGEDRSREWVEIYNSGPGEVTIPTGADNLSWRFSDALQHTFVATKGTSRIAPGAYALIVDNSLKFNQEWRNYGSTIFDSSISLNNNFGDLSLLAGKNGSVINRVTYSSSLGASGDGNSLQLQENGEWIPALPTPGMKNSAMVNISSDPTNRRTNNNLSAHYGSLDASQRVKIPTIGLGLGRQRIAAFGSPMEFRAETNFDTSKYKSFIWNFGDGSEKGGSIQSHTYQYPGDYVVVLNASFPQGNAVARVDVKVIDPNFAIIDADADKITIKNNSAYEVSLFGRALFSGDKFFVFLKDTIIGPYQALSFGSGVTGLSPENINDVFVLVLGDTEHPKFKAKIEQERIKQISNIKAQIEDLQRKMGEIFSVQKK